MQLVITEKQLRKLSSQITANQEVTEEDGDAAAAAPEAGTSSDGANKTGASKWESGVTRGPGNQIGVTKWSDVVGASLKRGKANPLREQDVSSSFVKILRPDGKIMNAPLNTKIVGLFDESAMDGGRFKDSLKNLLSKENGGLGNRKTQMWIPSDWSKIIKINSVSTFTTPDNKTYKASLRHPKLDELGKKKATWDQFYMLDPEPNNWKFYGYFTDQGTAFNGLKEVESFWDEWKYWILAGASIVAFIVIPGIGGLLLSIGIDLVAGAMQYAEGDTMGAGISVILAFLPVIGKVIPALKVSEEVATKLAKQFAPLNSADEVLDAVKGLNPQIKLSQQERYLMQKLISEDPKKLTALIEKEMFGHITQTNGAEIVSKLNELIKTKVLDKVKAEKIYKSLGLKRFGFDLTASGLIIYAGIKVEEYLNKKAQQQAFQGILPSDEDQQIAILSKKAKEQDAATYSMIIKPIFEKYGGMYDVYDENKLNKLRKIQRGVLQAFLKDPNSDLDTIATQLDKN